MSSNLFEGFEPGILDRSRELVLDGAPSRDLNRRPSDRNERADQGCSKHAESQMVFILAGSQLYRVPM